MVSMMYPYVSRFSDLMGLEQEGGQIRLMDGVMMSYVLDFGATVGLLRIQTF